MNRSYTEYLKLKHRLKMRWKRWKRRDSRRRSKQTIVGNAIGPNGEEEHTGSGSLDIDQVIIAGGEDEVSAILKNIYIF